MRAAAFLAFIPVNLRARFYDAAHEASDGDAMYANAQADIMLGVAAEAGVAAAPALTRIFSRSTTQSTGVMLREGDAVLAIVKDGRILAQSGDMLMSHQLFDARTIGSVPKGAEVVTIGKFEGQIMAITSKTVHGNQLPAPAATQAAAQAAFK